MWNAQAYGRALCPQGSNCERQHPFWSSASEATVTCIHPISRTEHLLASDLSRTTQIPARSSIPKSHEPFPRPLPNVWNAAPTSFISNAKSSTKRAPLPPPSHTPRTRPISPIHTRRSGTSATAGCCCNSLSPSRVAECIPLDAQVHSTSRNSPILRGNALRHSHCSLTQVHRHVALRVARMHHGD